MKFSLGFLSDGPVNFEVDSILYLNLFNVLKNSGGSLEKLNQSIDDFLKNFNSMEDIYISSVAPLHQQMITESVGFSQLNSSEIDSVKYILCEMYLKTLNFKKIDWVREEIETVDFSVKGLYVRYGMVEIRLIDSILRDCDQLNLAMQEIQGKQSSPEFMYEKMKQDAARWLSSGDLSFNIRSLMTNAGFYLQENSDNALLDLDQWKDAYISGILKGRLLSVPPAYPWFFSAWKRLQEVSRITYTPCYLDFPSPEHFFSMLKGKKVLVITPFKDQVDRMINEGRLKKLYRKFEITDIEFTVVEAPISTYPNRPGSGWADSFSQLKSAIDINFSNDKFDFFTASCGCYGIPICEYVYSKYDCTSLYYGNWLNTLLGIRQKCSLDFSSEVYEELRINSDLSKYKNMEKIDDGRYV